MPRSLAVRLRNISEYALLTAVFFLPFSIALLEACLIVCFIAWFGSKWLSREPLSSDKHLVLLAGSFWIISSVSGFYSGYPELVVRGLMKLIRYLLIMLATADLIQKRNFAVRLIAAGLIALGLVLADSIYQRIRGVDFFRSLAIFHPTTQIRLTGPFKSYGLLAAYLIAWIPLVLGFWFRSFEASKVVKAAAWSLLLMPALYVLYKTHSRGAWIGALFSWLIFAWLTRSKMLMFVLIVAAIIVPFALPRSTLIHLDRTQKEQSLVERYDLWVRAAQVIRARPLFGCGINTYVRNYPQFDQVKSWRVPGYYVHNGYLQIAAETGLIAMGLFLALLFKGFRGGARAFKSATRDLYLIAGILSAFVGLLLHAAVDTTLHNIQSAVLIWLLLGILIGVGQEGKTASRGTS